MGDNATEIDLDSVIDRLLEGASILFAPKIMIFPFHKTSIDPSFRNVGGIPSPRASTYHRVTSPSSVMRLLVSTLVNAERAGSYACPERLYTPALITSPFRSFRNLSFSLCPIHRL